MTRLAEPTLHSAQKGFVQAALAELAKPYVHIEIPFGGDLELATLAVAAGYAASDVQVSDCGLYGAALGMMASGNECALLDVRFEGELADFAEMIAGKQGFAAILLARAIAQLRPAKWFEQVQRRELLRDRVRLVDELHTDMRTAVAPLKGIGFELEDPWKHIERAMADPSAVLLLACPQTRNNMTAADRRVVEQVRWNVPAISGWEPKAAARRLYDMMAHAEALVIMLDTREPPAHWRDNVAHTVVLGHGERRYIVTNRPELLSAASVPRRPTRICPPMFPVADDDLVIGPQSVVQFVPTTKEVALYLRDLWAHRLGTTRAESYFLMVVDGRVTSVFGMFFDHIRRNAAPIVCETFGFSAPLRQYKRMNKLLMRCLVSGEARDFFASQAGVATSMLELDTFQTTCVSVVPETKGNRGIGLKLVERRTLPDGRYYLNFRAPFSKARFKDSLATWLQRDAHVQLAGAKADD